MCNSGGNETELHHNTRMGNGVKILNGVTSLSELWTRLCREQKQISFFLVSHLCALKKKKPSCSFEGQNWATKKLLVWRIFIWQWRGYWSETQLFYMLVRNFLWFFGSFTHTTSDLYMITTVAMQNRQRSALMMSNAQFLFVARSCINIKRLRDRDRERDRGACVWYRTVNRQINVSSLTPRKNTMPVGLNLEDSHLFLLQRNPSFCIVL